MKQLLYFPGYLSYVNVSYVAIDTSFQVRFDFTTSISHKVRPLRNMIVGKSREICVYSRKSAEVMITNDEWWDGNVLDTFLPGTDIKKAGESSNTWQISSAFPLHYLAPLHIKTVPIWFDQTLYILLKFASLFNMMFLLLGL